MGLESSDSLWLTSLCNYIHSLSNTYKKWKWLQLFIHGDEEAWVHGGGKEEEKVGVIFHCQVLGIGEGDEDGEEAGHTDGCNEGSMSVDRVYSHGSLTHMHKSLKIMITSLPLKLIT